MLRGIGRAQKASVFVIQDGRGQVMTQGGNPNDAGGIPPLARGAAPPSRHPGGTGDRRPRRTDCSGVPSVRAPVTGNRSCKRVVPKLSPNSEAHPPTRPRAGRTITSTTRAAAISPSPGTNASRSMAGRSSSPAARCGGRSSDPAHLLRRGAGRRPPPEHDARVREARCGVHVAGGGFSSVQDFGR